ncbi:ATP phosphoribosyltransferase [Rhodobium gokarnense]|uniref:ATP phosphoribosyltransferase n=1 Tax=Rhodobium gokarnense TaxID=364296 RepID=A0ABT3HCM4_9HYPH|nr:ATP phosphoribosyltransferase [Rhodobium gokarnense]MCW2308143.1 ATP phosphoribosyltransferase [Rhodobium gokarnense]
MSRDLILAVPSKGRLQENAAAFFARAGLKLEQPGGARNYRGRIKGLDGVEIAFLSASEIARELAAGNVHFGVTGLDLVYETVAEPDTCLHLVTPLGFGHADVVVAVPKAWIDVSTMSDLSDVAQDMRASSGRAMRVATKYIRTTRAFFAENGIADYRIVESLGATEGAPASGVAELIVDITTTGATLVANNLKILSDGVIRRSQAHLVAALRAPWDEEPLAAARTILDRIAAEARAGQIREIRTTVARAAMLGHDAVSRFGATVPFGAQGSNLVLHCPVDEVYPCVVWLRENGAETVTVSSVDYVFEATNPLFAGLKGRIGEG